MEGKEENKIVERETGQERERFLKTLTRGES